ncbi:HD domain-containing phosphohydrolase [Vallitalea okinawensis]|uniref:HD domain-containing phosphohydrolase n=1 Tax=Vallitalea okinawensis TaxID=2078660 RepID=UPI0013004161|nr:HD domain-containing phosphohydrolase [Vallitalea okinawensis]
MNRIKFVLLIFLPLIFIISFMYISITEEMNRENTVHLIPLQPPIEKRTILVIHSYDEGFAWTAGLQESITKVTQESDTHEYQIETEYLDTKQFHTEEYMDILVQELTYKYQDTPMDGIIVTDDIGFELVMELNEDVFKDIPIVAIGINKVYSEAQIEDGISIIPEVIPYIDNLEQAIALQPNAENVHLIIDSTPTGQYNKHQMLEAYKTYEDRYNFYYYDNASLDEVEVVLKNSDPDDDIILYIIFAVDSQEVRFNPTKTLSSLASISNAPIYAIYEYQFVSNVLGGYMSSTYSFALEAINALQGYWQCKKVPKILHDYDNVFNYVYDYPVFERYKLDKNNLPNDAILLNEPPDYFLENRDLVRNFLMTVLTFSFVVIYLLFIYRRQLNMDRQRKELLEMSDELLDTQKEIIYRLGSIIEQRSSATSAHVKRVAEISYLLAVRAGVGEQDAKNLKVASALHDLGKIGIPESILSKPGTLTQEEFTVVKTHTQIGYDLLKDSKRELFKMIASIALQHHERWDGRGYPNGLQGEAIDLPSRIVAIADVFDALCSKRVYKEAWDIDEVLEYLEEQKGKQFDPYLIRIFLDYRQEFIDIRYSYDEDL